MMSLLESLGCQLEVMLMQSQTVSQENRSTLRGFWGFILMFLAIFSMPCELLAFFAFFYKGEIYNDLDPWIPLNQSLIGTVLICLPIALALFAKQVLNPRYSIRLALKRAFIQSFLLVCFVFAGSAALKYWIFH